MAQVPSEREAQFARNRKEQWQMGRQTSRRRTSTVPTSTRFPHFGSFSAHLGSRQVHTVIPALPWERGTKS